MPTTNVGGYPVMFFYGDAMHTPPPEAFNVLPCTIRLFDGTLLRVGGWDQESGRPVNLQRIKTSELNTEPIFDAAVLPDEPVSLFHYDGEEYAFPLFRFHEETCVIQLPNGTLLEVVDGWRESRPPQPMRLRPMSKHEAATRTVFRATRDPW